MMPVLMMKCYHCQDKWHCTNTHSGTLINKYRSRNALMLLRWLITQGVCIGVAPIPIIYTFFCWLDNCSHAIWASQSWLKIDTFSAIYNLMDVRCTLAEDRVKAYWNSVCICHIVDKSIKKLGISQHRSLSMERVLEWRLRNWLEAINGEGSRQSVQGSAHIPGWSIFLRNQ